MVMKQKKTFVPPTVVQTVRLSLEEDLLLGPSSEMSIIAAGQDYFEWNTDLEDVYTVDDWTLSD
jgi:hypothetical protein